MLVMHIQGDGAMKCLFFVSNCACSRLETYQNACMNDDVEQMTCMLVDVQPCYIFERGF